MIPVNILIRTSSRPNYFKHCMDSIINQTYKNINVIVCYDDKDSINYINNHKQHINTIINVNRINVNTMTPKVIQGIGCNPAPWNLYFNAMYQHVVSGLVMFIDDDDKLHDNNSIKHIVDSIKSEDELYFWRVKFPDRLIPNDNYFGKKPTAGQISTLGFAFHTKYISHAKWGNYNFGDYRVASQLYDIVPNKIYINKTLTSIQRAVANGLGRRDDLIK